MRIIALSDIHMSAANMASIPGICDADLVILNGDLTNYGNRDDAKTILNEVLGFNPRVLAQLGNLDNIEINDYLEDLGMNLHGQARLFQSQVCFFGVGGSNITPFRTPTEFTEDELAALLQQGYQQAKEFIGLAEPLNKKRIPLVLVSHTPPRNTTVDRLRDGSHVGSQAVRDFIEHHDLDLCLTGHIHEAKNSDTIATTPVINPGMVRDGGWVDIQIEHSTLTATLQ